MSSDNLPIFNPEFEEAVLTKSKEKLKKPPLYKVLLHNDDFTSMEFVVLVLCEIFGHSKPNAIAIMLQVHVEGIGIAGIYSYEIAEMKVAKVIQLAREKEYPLLCTIEEDSADSE